MAKQLQSALAAAIQRRDGEKANFANRMKLEREGMYSMVDERISAIKSSPREFLAYLNMQAIVPHYTVNNALLIMSQCQTASDVRTADAWRNVGRYYIQKDDGIKIFVPKDYIRETTREQPGIYDEVQTVTMQEQRRGYDIGTVFDVSQTRGEALPPLFSLSGKPELTDQATDKLLSMVPGNIRVLVDNSMESRAMYDPRTRQIYIRDDMNAGDTFAGLAGAVVQAKIHTTTGNSNYYEPAEYALESEAAAHVLCRRFGVDVPTPDFSYATPILSELDSQSVKARLFIVRDISKDMGREIDRAINPQSFQRNQTQQHQQRRDYRAPQK